MNNLNILCRALVYAIKENGIYEGHIKILGDQILANINNDVLIKFDKLTEEIRNFIIRDCPTIDCFPEHGYIEESVYVPEHDFYTLKVSFTKYIRPGYEEDEESKEIERALREYR